MKVLTNCILVAVLSLFTVTVFAQDLSATNTILPNTISCSVADLNAPFSTTKEKNTTLSSGSSIFSGEVLSNVIKSKTLQYVTIRLANMNNAILALSKRMNEEGNTIYVGHIINSKTKEAYKLKRIDDGSFQFEKIDFDKLLPACSPE